MESKRIANFKMEVTPGQSAIVQDFLFKNGASWASCEREICFCDKPFLFFEDGDLYCGTKKEFYEEDKLPKLSFKTFENKYLL